MAMAESNPSPNQKRDPITRFRDAYSIALADARIFSDYTKTEGWQRIYLGQRNEEQSRRRDLSKRLEAMAATVNDRTLSEDEEKEVGEIKKACADVREMRYAFGKQTVDPVRDAATECNRIIDEAKSLARREEQDAPLVNVGLEDMMRLEIQQVERVRFDEETGKLTIAPPSTAD